MAKKMRGKVVGKKSKKSKSKVEGKKLKTKKTDPKNKHWLAELAEKKLEKKKPSRRPEAEPIAKTNPVWNLNVVSSNIERAAFHCKRKELLIVFKSGAAYIYEDVSVKEFFAFTLAKSQGMHLTSEIKPNKAVRKLRDGKKD